jgi:DNA-binding NtrC family response regulator
VDVRVIAATNRDLAASLASGRLRSDLYYRLNVLPIELPPLRERLADVPALAHHFLAAAAEEVGRPPMTFEPEVLDALAAHDWPGNIRELKNLLRRLAALCPGQRITRDLLPPALARVPAAATTASDAAPPAAAPPADRERARTLAALGAAASMAEAAARLGVTRSTLYRRLARYGMQAQRSVRASTL